MPPFRVLTVDLASGKAERSTIPEDVAVRFLGGRGLGAWLLASLTGPSSGPFDPDTPIIITCGPLTGARIPSADRFSLSTLSPLTGTVMDTNSGGRLGRALRRCGLEVLILRGAAPRPVTLAVTGSGPELSPAGRLWGLSVSETLGELSSRTGPEAGLAVIGPAGENRVRYASIMTDRMRALGRGGAGAVMGAKGLKAIVVRGESEVPIADRERLKVVLEECNRWLQAHPVTSKALPLLGTPMLVRICSRAGIFPMANFQRVAADESEAYSGETLARSFTVGRSGCSGCYIRCGRTTRIGDLTGEGPEYESLWALGPDLELQSLGDVIRASYLCNDLGLDTISTGGTLACAMELAQKGIRPSSLRFGDPASVFAAIAAISRREGEGGMLAEGSRRLARAAGAEELSMQVKGMELPGYDPRGAQGQALAYATSSRGGCHLRGGYLIAREVLGIPKKLSAREILGKGGHVARAQDFGAVADSLSACRFATFALSPEYWSRILEAVTGWSLSGEDLMEAGERIVNLERILNLSRGIGPEQDTLPPRFLQEPLREGPCAGEVVHLEEMKSEYYAHRRWPGGVPSDAVKKELGLDGEDIGVLHKAG